MKTRYYFLFILFPLFVGCNGNKPIPPYISLYNTLVVKFSKPEYKDYIYAERYGDEEYRFREEGYRSVADEFYAGKCPYIDLGEGYYLTDWKWPWHIYSDDVVLKLPWSEMTSRDQRFGKDTVEIFPWPYIEEQYTVYFYDIDNYLNILKHEIPNDGDIDFFAYSYNWMCTEKNKYIKGDREEYERCVARCDSIQAEYVQKLRWIVESGNFPFKGKYGGLK